MPDAVVGASVTKTNRFLLSRSMKSLIKCYSHARARDQLLIWETVARKVSWCK